MKKMISVILCALMVCSLAACSAQKTESTSRDESEIQSSVPSADDTSVASDAVSFTPEESSVHDILESYGFEGVFYVEKDGGPIVSFAAGTREDGDDYKIDTPMPVGSVSKQFCACAILRLNEQNKLSLDDTLDKYFPEYEIGKNITIKNLLSMRSGIPNYTEGSAARDVSVDKTEEENIKIIKDWLFETPLIFEPDSAYTYSNSNYFLLSLIVEQLSGKKYIDYLRESFFAPLGMDHTGDIAEMAAAADWAGGVSYKNVDLQPGITKGAGDIITTAKDMTTWMNSLTGGKVVSEESYKAMTTNYSGDQKYGYGLFVPYFNGIGHPGAINNYIAADYFNTDKKVTLFFSTDTVGMGSYNEMIVKILTELGCGEGL